MTYLKIFVAALTCFFGLSAFVAFSLLKNYFCASLGLLAGMTDSILLLLHILVKKNKLKDWYTKSQLQCFTRFSVVFLVAGVASAIYFATVEIVYRTPIMPIESSKVLPLIWCVIVVRGAVILLYYSMSYQKLYDPEYQRLVSDSNECSEQVTGNASNA